MARQTSDVERMETYGFVYGQILVPYRVERTTANPDKPRKVSIRVTPHSRVIVKAPDDAEKTDVHDTVMKRARWIYDKLQGFDAQRAPVQPRQYVSGDMMFYLGRRNVLKVVKGTDTASQVKMEREKLLVTVPDGVVNSTVHVREPLRQWYRTCAQHMFSLRLDHLLPHKSTG